LGACHDVPSSQRGRWLGSFWGQRGQCHQGRKRCCGLHFCGLCHRGRECCEQANRLDALIAPGCPRAARLAGDWTERLNALHKQVPGALRLPPRVLCSAQGLHVCARPCQRLGNGKNLKKIARKKIVNLALPTYSAVVTIQALQRSRDSGGDGSRQSRFCVRCRC